jgi:phosphoglycerate-specific signal transduction histidine kinase
MIVEARRLKEVQQRVAPVFQSLLSAMAAIAGHYTASELEAIAGFFRETTQALRTETRKLRKRKTANSWE